MNPIAINIGHEAVVLTGKLVAILPPDASPIKALRKEAKEAGLTPAGRLLDATAGKPTRSVLVMESGHVVLSSLTPETIEKRLLRAIEKPQPEQDYS